MEDIEYMYVVADKMRSCQPFSNPYNLGVQVIPQVEYLMIKFVNAWSEEILILYI